MSIQKTVNKMTPEQVTDKLSQYKAKAQERKEIFAAIDREKLQRVIKAENEAREQIVLMAQHINDNKHLLTGKKIILSNGDNSQVLDKILKEFKPKFSKLVNPYKHASLSVSRRFNKSVGIYVRIPLSGGVHSDEKNLYNTSYSMYIEKNVHFASFDDLGTLESLETVEAVENSTNQRYTVKGVNKAKKQAQKLHDKIEALKSQYRAQINLIPQQLKPSHRI